MSSSSSAPGFNGETGFGDHPEMPDPCRRYASFRSEIRHDLVAPDGRRLEGFVEDIESVAAIACLGAMMGFALPTTVCPAGFTSRTEILVREAEPKAPSRG